MKKIAKYSFQYKILLYQIRYISFNDPVMLQGYNL